MDEHGAPSATPRPADAGVEERALPRLLVGLRPARALDLPQAGLAGAVEARTRTTLLDLLGLRFGDVDDGTLELEGAVPGRARGLAIRPGPAQARLEPRHGRSRSLQDRPGVPGRRLRGRAPTARAGRKTSHRIWYIFPQISGLGSSPMATTYALASPLEAESYLRDPVLADRLLAVTEAVCQHLSRTPPVPIRS